MRYAVWAAFRAQLVSFARAPVTVGLVLLLPLNMLVLLSLFALTGYNAPTALVFQERTPMAEAFADVLRDIHHSFKIREMPLDEAQRQLRDTRLVAIIEIPRGFQDGVTAGDTVPVNLTLDNVNLDVAEDVRRAAAAAAARFANQQRFPEVRVRVNLSDVQAKDTGYVEYLAVSAVALAAVLTGGILGGTVTAREWETGAAKVARTAPLGVAPLLLGRTFAAAALSAVASLLTLVIVSVGYSLPIAHPLEAVAAVILTAVCSAALGGLLGTWLRKALLVVPLVVGIALPFYLDSGAVEPQRFDGPVLFWLAHMLPTYFGVGLVQHAHLNLVVTPEPRWALMAVLAGASAVCFWLLAKRGDA